MKNTHTLVSPDQSATEPGSSRNGKPGAFPTLSRRRLLQQGALSLVGMSLAEHALAESVRRLAGSVAEAVGGSIASESVSIKKLAQYQIVVPDPAGAGEQHAAERLQHHLSGLTGKTLVLRKESEYRNGPAFFLGRSRYAQTQKIDFELLAVDGFAFHPVGNNLIIAGGTGKGVLYGVYDLLELSGFRMYTSKAIDTPKTKSISIPKLRQVVPDVRYRTTSYADTRDAEYSDWHRLSSREAWGLFVHTFNELVPPDTFGKTHPEYFSLINGNRVPGTQLCLSNHEVLATVIASLRAKIASKPDATYWSVSQNDNDQYCRCGPCSEMNAKYGGVPSGSILYFVNDVAKAFPDKIISTLAYWYSRTPPGNIQAEPNVNIMLCNIESRRQGPVFETDPAFSRELISWGKISGNILIWDYNIQFSNLVSPFPNLHTIKPNIKFYTDHHVNSLYMQANGQVGGEMAGLRAYLICKLMWDPTADDGAIMDDYLNGYYGAAGRSIREYIDTMRASLLSTGFKLDIFGSPEAAKDAYLSADMLRAYQQIFDKAEKAVANDPTLLARVKIARLPILYAEIQIGRNEVDTPRSMFAHAPGGRVTVKPEMRAYVREFVKGCKDDGVTRVRERTTPPDDYLASYERVFAEVEETHQALSFGKKIVPVTLPEGGAETAQKLTDGIFGSWESWSAPDVHWVAYKGQHMDFVLDLGETKDVHFINMDFLNAQAQPDWNVMVLPVYVSYATSVDGSMFDNEIKIQNPLNPNPRENPDISKVPVQSFRADLSPGVRARYLKVHGESMLRMPPWHIRSGQPALIYTDQIVVG
jgi:hypothetical protein